MSHFINPFTDYGFKKIFGQEVSKELLIDFLNSLLLGERVIKDLTFLNNERLPGDEDMRAIIYDVYCTTDSGEQIIVEMQNRTQSNFKERALYYVARALSEQGQKGRGWQYSVKAVYGIFFMNFTFEGEEAKFRTDVILSDRDTGKMFCDKMRQIFITMPLFDKDERSCTTDFERWIFVLKHMETLNRMPFKARKMLFERLEELCDVENLPAKERHMYERSLDIYRTNLAIESYAKEQQEKAWEKGLAQGLAQGHAQGHAEGLAQGHTQGHAEGILETARKMKVSGVSMEIIKACTGLSYEEIEQL